LLAFNLWQIENAPAAHEKKRYCGATDTTSFFFLNAVNRFVWTRLFVERMGPPKRLTTKFKIGGMPEQDRKNSHGQRSESTPDKKTGDVPRFGNHIGGYHIGGILDVPTISVAIGVCFSKKRRSPNSISRQK